MEIDYIEDFFGNSYRITIGQGEDLEALEVAECFKKQFPEFPCVISFSKIVKVQAGVILVNIKLPTKKQKELENDILPYPKG